MKKKLVTSVLAAALAVGALAGCKGSSEVTEESCKSETASEDQKAADRVAKLIDAIYVQERTEKTDDQCKEAKEAWDALTDKQKAMVSGENADPDYFGRDTGDASLDDPLNEDNIGDKEILVLSFGTSFNDSRVKDISKVEKSVQKAYPDYSVRRAFTAQIIINHIQARDEEKIDNVDQAMDRAVANGVKELIVLPTHLMQGKEYDELKSINDAFLRDFPPLPEEDVRQAILLIQRKKDRYDSLLANEEKYNSTNSSNMEELATLQLDLYTALHPYAEVYGMNLYEDANEGELLSNLTEQLSLYQEYQKNERELHRLSGEIGSETERICRPYATSARHSTVSFSVSR